LSPREGEICSLAGQGLTDKGIAAALGISLHTVGSYWQKIFGKLHVHSRAAAAVLQVTLRDK
jgi:DNA-binding NarL/FixJ family response regulator